MADEKVEEAPAPAAAPSADGPNKLIMGILALNLVVMIAVVVVLFLGHKKQQERPDLGQIAEGAAQSEGGEHGGGEHSGGEEHGGGEHGGGEHGGGAAVEPRSEVRFFSIGDVLTNLSGPASAHYVKISINFEISKDTEEDDLRQRKSQMRDKIISILNAKQAAELQSSEGRNALKEEIKTVVNSSLTKGRVEGVYFSSFVIN